MCAAHTLVINVSSSHVRIDEWLPTASTFCPLSLFSKKVQSVNPSYTLKWNHHLWTIPRDYWWLFQMLHVSHYGAIG